MLNAFGKINMSVVSHSANQRLPTCIFLGSLFILLWTGCSQEAKPEVPLITFHLRNDFNKDQSFWESSHFELPDPEEPVETAAGGSEGLEAEKVSIASHAKEQLKMQKDPAFQKLKRLEIPVNENSRSRVVKSRQSTKPDIIASKEKQVLFAGRDFNLKGFESVAPPQSTINFDHHLVESLPHEGDLETVEHLDLSAKVRPHDKTLVFHGRPNGWFESGDDEFLQEEVFEKNQRPKTQKEIEEIPETKVLNLANGESYLTLTPNEKKLDLFGNHQTVDRGYFDLD